MTSIPLRIAVDARPLSIPQTGIGRYTYEVLRRLVEAGHEWFLYSDRPLLREFPAAKNVHVRVGRSSHRLSGALYPQLVFSRWARQDAVDIYWTPRHHLPLRLPASVRTVVTLHDLVYLKAPETMQPMGRRLESWLTPRSLQRADTVIVDACSTVVDLQHAFGELAEKATVVHLASTPNSMSQSLSSPMPAPYFLFAGTREPRKNLARLLRAFAQQQSHLANTHLVLAGDVGWGDQKVEQWVAELGIQSRVSITGRLDETTLHRYYRHALALVMPSLYEGFGLPLLEAMQYGVPVITSNRSSMPEVMGEGGIAVDPESEAAIGEALVRMVTEPGLREQLGSAARIQVGNFDWNLAAAQTMSALLGDKKQAVGEAGYSGRG